MLNTVPTEPGGTATSVLHLQRNTQDRIKAVVFMWPSPSPLPKATCVTSASSNFTTFTTA